MGYKSPHMYSIAFVQQYSAAALVDLQAYYFSMGDSLNPTEISHRIYVLRSGIIRQAIFYGNFVTAGTNEAWPMYVRVNMATDFLIESIGISNVHRVWKNHALNIPVSAGDIIAIKHVGPTWVTNPAGMLVTGNILIECE